MLLISFLFLQPGVNNMDVAAGMYTIYGDTLDLI